MGALDDMLGNQPSNSNGYTNGSALDAMMGNKSTSYIPQNQEQSIYDMAGNVFSALAEPASAALDAISYLDKPRGAIAGTVKALEDGTSMWEGAKSGWNNNTSWKETFNQQWVKDHPTEAPILGFGADILLDPTWLITPAKAVGGLAKTSKVLGITDKIEPLVNRVAESGFGQKTINTFNDVLGLNNPLESANEAYNATKASLMGPTKEGLDQVQRIIQEALPDANRADVESYVQRMVESYPDIGTFARSADKTTARDAVINTLYNNLDTANSGLKAAKESVGKIGQLTDDEKAVADILKDNNVSPDKVGTAVTAAQNMGEVIPQTARTAQGIDENIKIKRAAVNLILSGKISEEDLPKIRTLFSDEELSKLMPSLEKRFKDSPALDEIKAGMQTSPGIPNITPASRLEETAINDLPETAKKINLNPDLDQVSLNTDLTKNLPDLMNSTSLSEKVLPDIRIGTKPQTAVNLSNITEDGRRLLANVQNVPELAQKIKTNTELQRQLNAVDKAKEALQRADVSPEKLTQVLDSAMKNGYTPTQVEAMFKASETMRNINQMMTTEAMKRALIPLEVAGEYSGGRHLRRMYAALENPEQHYTNLVNSGNKEVADKFWEAYSKFEGDAKSRGININMGTFESRKNLPKALQDQLGRLYEATYPFAKGNKIAAEQYAKYDFLKEVANKFGSDAMQPGYRKVPTTIDGKLGQLEGKFLPERVFKDVMFSAAKLNKETTTWEKNVQRWKALKLINPASISRNVMSGAVMANVFGEVPLQKIPGLISDSITDMRKGTERYLQARNSGMFEANISKSDLASIANKVRGEKTGLVDKFDTLLGKGMNVFSMPDSFWRMVVFNHHMDSGKTVQEAVKMANRSQFDYSNAPRWIESLSRTGIIPFAKYPFFAAKETARSLYNNPAQITKYTKMQNQTNTEDREKILPDYMKAKTLLPTGESARIVNGKTQKVQGNVDLSYILPFSNDISVGNPLIDALQLYRTGQNSIGQQIIKPGMTDKEKAKAWAEFGANSALPSLVSPYSLEKAYNAYNGNVDRMGRQYDKTDAAMQLLLGIKNVPINTDEMFKQKQGGLIRQINDTKDLIKQTARNQSLSQAQKKEQITEYINQIKNISSQIKDTQGAYQREKQRGAI